MIHAFNLHIYFSEMLHLYYIIYDIFSHVDKCFNACFFGFFFFLHVIHFQIIFEWFFPPAWFIYFRVLFFHLFLRLFFNQMNEFNSTSDFPQFNYLTWFPYFYIMFLHDSFISHYDSCIFSIREVSLSWFPSNLQKYYVDNAIMRHEA